MPRRYVNAVPLQLFRGDNNPDLLLQLVHEAARTPVDVTDYPDARCRLWARERGTDAPVYGPYEAALVAAAAGQWSFDPTLLLGAVALPGRYELEARLTLAGDDSDEQTVTNLVDLEVLERFAP